MKKSLQAKFRHYLHTHSIQLLISSVIGLFLLGVILVIGLFVYYKHRVLPGVFVAGYPVSGLTLDQLETVIQTQQSSFAATTQLTIESTQSIQASASAQELFPLSYDKLELEYDTNQTAQAVMKAGRDKPFWVWLPGLLNTAYQHTNVEYIYSLNDQKLRQYLERLAELVEQPGAKPELVYDTTRQPPLEVLLGEDGVTIDINQAAFEVISRIKSLDSMPIPLVIIKADNRLTADQAQIALLRAEQLLTKSLNVKVPESSSRQDQVWQLSGPELINFIDLRGGFDEKKLREYTSKLAENIDRPPQNANFEFTNGKVEVFVPAQNGVQLEVDASVNALIAGLGLLEVSDTPQEVTLITTQVSPEIATSDVNSLGIKELIGRGESTYRGSIPGRVHNVALTASRLHGVLIPPGETFSFNKTIGEVSAATGYKAAYVIRNGRTELGDGGGVCQDSTTLFRAALNAGLPITKWKAHSYRVGYYEQNSKPGFDATVYSPSVDFQFINDTPAHILIQAQADSDNKTLVIELYGTSDGREAVISNYQQWDAVPAPPPLYQDDPSLGPGVVKQVDWAAAGLKTKFEYTVRRDGQTIFEKTFYSNFRPWQAVYLRGV